MICCALFGSRRKSVTAYISQVSVLLRSRHTITLTQHKAQVLALWPLEIVVLSPHSASLCYCDVSEGVLGPEGHGLSEERAGGGTETQHWRPEESRLVSWTAAARGVLLCDTTVKAILHPKTSHSHVIPNL